MKVFLIMGGILTVTLCTLSGCGSQLGGPIYDDQRASVQNQNTKENMEQYIQPSASVYK